MATRYEVTGSVAVVPLKREGERYVYKGGVISDAESTAEGIEHLLGAGLIVELSEPVDESSPYGDVNVADLKADIKKRNEGRAEADLIVPAEPGNRAELVAALVADDTK